MVFLSICIFSSVSYAESINPKIIDLHTDKKVQLADLTSIQIMTEGLCYAGNLSSHAVKLARTIRNYNFNFEDMEVLGSWAEFYGGGVIELRWSLKSVNTPDIFTGVSVIQNCSQME